VNGTAIQEELRIWRESFPAKVFAAWVCSLQSKPRTRRLRRGDRQWKSPPPLLSLLLALVLFTHASALLMYVGYCFLPSHAHAMTKGCEKAICCTAFCYLDKNGVHHCVHAPGGDSCECGFSANDSDEDSPLLSIIGTLTDLDILIPVFLPAEWISPVCSLRLAYTPTIPSPPPKIAGS
jgi:hypothetical protein